MSGSMHDKDLARRAEGDADVSKRYRELGDEMVPAALDQRVLDLAREAVSGQPVKRARRQRQWIRWGAPFAIAASALLTLSIVMQSGVQEEAAIRMQYPTPASAPPAEKAELRDAQVSLDSSEAPAPAGSAAEEADAARVRALLDEQSTQRSAMSRREEGQLARQRAEEVVVDARKRSESVQNSPVAGVAADESQFAATPPAPSIAAAESAPPPAQPRQREPLASAGAASERADVQQVVVTGAKRRNEAPRVGGPRDTVRALTSSQVESERYAEDRERDPDEWLEEIRELRRKGRDRDADEEWKRFLGAHPSHRVERSDLARPASERGG